MRKFILFFLTLFTTVAIFATEPFNANLSAENKALLEKGETVIINTSSYKKICINNYNENSSKLISEINTLKPNYVAEIIKVFPYKGNENLIEEMNKILIDVPSYKGIPYYSVNHNVWGELYYKADVINQNITPTHSTIAATLGTLPFGLFNVNIDITNSNESLYYKCYNTSVISYGKMDILSPNMMNSVIIVDKVDDNWVMYAVAIVKGPKVPGLTERIDNSFIGRIKTFCSYCFSKLQK